MSSGRPAGVMEVARCGKWRRNASKHGRPTSGEGGSSAAPMGAGPEWVAEGLVVPLKPGNSGGGKGPQGRVLRKERRRRRLARAYELRAVLRMLSTELYHGA